MLCAGTILLVGAVISLGVAALYGQLPPPPPLDPMVNFDPTSRTTNDKAGFVVLNVTLSKSSTKTITVQYATGGMATATAGSDYKASSGTLTFEPGITSQAIVVEIIDDGTGEPSEYFTVTLSNPTNAIVGASTCTVNIEDGAGSSPAFVAFEDEGWGVSEGGGTVTITVKMTGSPSSDVSVDYATGNWTAIAGSDYTAKSGTLYWSKTDAGQTRSFTVSITNDSDVEGTQVFFVVLSNPVNAALAYPSAAAVNILDDEITCSDD
jgi:hypothetical protein